MTGKHTRRHHKDRTTPGSDNRKARVDYERKCQDDPDPDPWWEREREEADRAAMEPGGELNE